MEQGSVEQILLLLFGGSIDATKIATWVVIIFNVVMAIYQWHAKKKVIKADIELATADAKYAAQKEELDAMKKALGELSNMFVTAYLSSNTIDAQTKQKIAVFANSINTLSGLKLEESTNQLIALVSNFCPNVNEVAEDIKAEAKVAEDLLDDANSKTEDIIDKIQL